MINEIEHIISFYDGSPMPRLTLESANATVGSHQIMGRYEMVAHVLIVSLGCPVANVCSKPLILLTHLEGTICFGETLCRIA